jgi:LmbE family N-acetylglucosaminyl deacetylase
MERILVVVAHPDDAELSCGGSVARWTREGNEVTFVICTDGGKGTKDRNVSPDRLAGVREEEQQGAARVLGVKDICFLRHGDGDLEVTKDFRAEIALLIRHYRPFSIVTHDPWRPYSIHPDHRAVGFTTVDAVVAARDHLFIGHQYTAGFEPHDAGQILFTFPEKVDFVVDISETMDVKLEAIGCHTSQIGDEFPLWEERMRRWAEETAANEPFLYGEGFKKLAIGRHHYNPADRQASGTERE